MRHLPLLLLAACAPSGPFDRFELPPRNVSGVAGASADDVWVSGEGTTQNATGSLLGLSRWDGTAWTDVPMDAFGDAPWAAELPPPAAVLGGAFVVGGEVYQGSLTQWTGYSNAQRSAPDGALWFVVEGQLGKLHPDGAWEDATALPATWANDAWRLASTDDGVLIALQAESNAAWTWHWWDGSSLADLPAPDGGFPRDIVRLFGHDDAWVALGEAEGSTSLAHFDGASWTILPPQDARYSPFASGPIARTADGWAWLGDSGQLIESDGATTTVHDAAVPDRYAEPPEGLSYGVRLFAAAASGDDVVAITHERELQPVSGGLYERYALVSWRWSGEAWTDRTVLAGRRRCFACDAWTFQHALLANGDFVGFWHATVNDASPEFAYAGAPR